MDPITAALLAAIAAGAAAGATDVSKSALVDAYNSLKGLIQRKFGHASDVAKALDAVEAKPDSTGRQATLEEEVAAAQADQDQELVDVAQSLLQKVGKLPGGQQIIQTVVGDHNITVTGTGNVISVNQPPPGEKKT